MVTTSKFVIEIVNLMKTSIFDILITRGYHPKFVLFNKYTNKLRLVYTTRIIDSDVMVLEEFNDYVLCSFPRKNVFGISDYIKIPKDIDELCMFLSDIIKMNQ